MRTLSSGANSVYAIEWRTAMIARAVLVALMLSAAGEALAQASAAVYPDRAWKKASPESLGWSPDGLRAADDYARSIRSDAYLVIHKGQVVHEYGEVSKTTNLHSVRKSILSILFGIQVDRGAAKLDPTLADLAINDKDGLIEIEKGATVRHLLQARSGIYHPAAYEPASMSVNRPPRGKFGPGENFNYNNWDFNALGTIFNKFAGKPVFDALQEDLAGPLQFEDFSMRDTRWVYERVLSQHPAYEIRLSARDLGRIGLLMARRGRWKERQIVSEDWVRESTTSYSHAGAGLGYGYMWWIGVDGWHFGQKFPGPVFSARGNYGQYLVVDSSRDLVIVHRVNSDKSNHPQVGGREFGALLARILAARPGSGTQ